MLQIEPTILVNVLRERVMGIVQQNPEGITMAELCNEMKKRGWAMPDVSPAKMGFDDDDILRIKPCKP